MVNRRNKYRWSQYDALKHIDSNFIDDFSKYILSNKEDFYFVGEYWMENQDILKDFIDKTSGNVDLLM